MSENKGLSVLDMQNKKLEIEGELEKGYKDNYEYYLIMQEEWKYADSLC